MSRSRVIALEHLKERTGVTDKQLDKEVDDLHLDDISEHIVDYRKYGPRLDLSQPDIATIERNPALMHSIKLITAAVFKEWHRKNVFQATYRVLVNVALRLEDGTGAEKICKARRGVISLDRIIEHTGVAEWQLDSECDDLLLDQIAQLIVEYRKYGPRLGVDSADINACEQNPRIFHSIKLITAEVFKLWHKNKKYDATYRALAEVALALGDGDGAEKICRICAKGVQARRDEPPSGPLKSPTSKAEASAKEQAVTATGGGSAATGGPSHQQLEGGSSQQDPPAASDSSAPLMKGIQRYCMEIEDDVDQPDSDIEVANAAAGIVRLHLRWDTTQIKELKVHFMNPELLVNEKWKIGGDDPLTVSQILSWATLWNSHGQKYPVILDEKATVDEAHIRVMFSRAYTSWSKVGKAARWEDKANPTMVLNLYRMDKPSQRSMVIHEFGHALGLDHEHQRSDFWDVLGKKDEDDDEYLYIIGREEMESGNGGTCQRACKAIFRADSKAPSGSDQTDYDQDSIMHYWFDIKWLQKHWQKEKNVRKSKDLTEEERRVLLGVHARDYHNGQLPKNPSPLDFEALNTAYGRPQEK